jgi:hypothetical protein
MWKFHKIVVSIVRRKEEAGPEGPADDPQRDWGQMETTKSAG